MVEPESSHTFQVGGNHGSSTEMASVTAVKETVLPKPSPEVVGPYSVGTSSYSSRLSALYVMV